MNLEVPLAGFSVSEVTTSPGDVSLALTPPSVGSGKALTARLSFGDTATLDGMVLDSQRAGMLRDVAVVSAMATNGTLTVEFDDGAKLRVEPLETAEAWNLSLPAGKIRCFVCCPGGEVVVFREPGLAARLADRFLGLIRE